MTGRLLHYVNLSPSHLFSILFSDFGASLKDTGQFDDGIEKSIESPNPALYAVIEGIVAISKINPIASQVSIQGASEPSMFLVSSVLLVPRVVLQLLAGNMELVNISFVVADCYTVFQYLVISLPVLLRLVIYSRTLR